MKLTTGQVKHVAKLANLSLQPDEEEKYAGQLSAILDYIDQLNRVNTRDIEPTFNVTGKSNIFAEDEIKPSLTPEEALQSAQINKNEFYVAKGVFQEE